MTKISRASGKKNPLEKGHEGLPPRKAEENGEGTFPREIQVRVSSTLPSRSVLCLFEVL